MNIFFAVWNLFLLTNCFFACREVWGLKGGFGRGRWAECSTYMMDAKSYRAGSIAWLVVFTVIHVLSYVNGEL